ncbi:ankyrin [Lentithecium fluviatile CBS 122367]|uniref:Ankyrin n=1 Tax=Lentithecium fluviatile CBS 122367 TaxID=1168545 RepID=A0A6G1ICX3_9PLEO|nr:ankyrin [Lentithecium fluviatile CBS 122367]
MVYFVHETTVAFFEESWKYWFPKAELRLAEVSLAYLSFQPFGFGPTVEVEERKRRHPFYWSACINIGWSPKKVLPATAIGTDLLERLFLGKPHIQSIWKALTKHAGYNRLPSLIDCAIPSPDGLHLAIVYQLDWVIQLLLQDVSTPRQDEPFTPLHLAARHGYQEGVRLLINHPEMHLDPRDRLGRTPFHIACEYGDVEMAHIFLSKRSKAPALASSVSTTIETSPNSAIDGNKCMHNGFTPLASAVQRRRANMVRLLLGTTRVDPKIPTAKGLSVLHLAAISDSVECTKLLLLRRPEISDFTTRTADGFSLLQLAVINDSVECASFLLQTLETSNLTMPTVKGLCVLHLSVIRDSVKCTRLLLQRPEIFIPSTPTPDGLLALDLAAINGSVECARLLLERPEVVNRINNRTGTGRKALSHAASSSKPGSAGVAKLILAQSDVDCVAPDLRGRAPMGYAAESCNIGVISLLLNRPQVDPNAAIDEDGSTLLFWTIERKQEFILRQLIENPIVHVNELMKDGSSHSWMRLFQRNDFLLKAILSQENIGFNACDSTGSILGHYIAQFGTEESMALLLAREDIDVNVCDSTGRTLLHYVAESRGRESMASLLAREGIRYPIKDEDGRTPLHYAVRSRAKAFLVQLLSKFGDKTGKSEICTLDGFEDTPLGLAIDEGSTEIVSVLLDRI